MIPVLIIPVMNTYDLLERCIESIDTTVGEICVIDNGDYLSENAFEWHHNHVRIVQMPHNLGISTSWNLGIKMYPFAPTWTIIGADVWFEPGFLDEWYAQASADNILTGAVPPWACFSIGRNVVRDVGLFCEQYHPAYFEDTDYERRAEKLRIEIKHSEILANHDNSSLLKDEKIAAKNAVTYNKNHETYIRRWSGLVGDETPQHDDWSLTIRCDRSWD